MCLDFMPNMKTCYCCYFPSCISLSTQKDPVVFAGTSLRTLHPPPLIGCLVSSSQPHWMLLHAAFVPTCRLMSELQMLGRDGLVPWGHQGSLLSIALILVSLLWYLVVQHTIYAVKYVTL